MALSQINVAISQNIPTAGNDVQEECPICYESFTNKTFASDCLHDFCYQCIRTWVKVRATCPLCLQPIAAIIKNVRSIDDYDIEQVVPPKTNVFEDYLRDFDMPEDILEYESSVEESMSMVSDFEDYEDESSGSNDNLQSAPHSLNGSSSNSQGSLFGILDVYGSDEDELSDISFSENVDSSSEDDEDDKDDDDDESDENHSDNENGNENESEEFYEDNDDEDDYDDNDNEDDYGDDGAEYYEAYHSKTDPDTSIPEQFYRFPAVPTKQRCMFCKGPHWSYLCHHKNYNMLENRRTYFRQYNLCPKCGILAKTDYCNQPQQSCRWF